MLRAVSLSPQSFSFRAQASSKSGRRSFFTASSCTDLDPYIEHVNRCNRGTLLERSKFVPFVADKVTVGFIHPSFLQHLLLFPKVFVAIGDYENYDSTTNVDCLVTLHHELKTNDDRTIAVDESLKMLHQKGLVPGWRNEKYPVINAFGSSPLFSIERAAVPFFGTKAYGVHLNGYVVDSAGKKWLWVAKRSRNKQTYPGRLDHLVAGGQPVGLCCHENVIKECDEEASIPEEIAKRSISVGAVSYEDVEGNKLKRDVLFCYDLELPQDFRPRNKDGEVESFSLLPMEKVEEILRTSDAYKPNCAIVVIDFLFRHGYLTSTSENDM